MNYAKPRTDIKTIEDFKAECPFCNPEGFKSRDHFIFETKYFYFAYDEMPVCEGHCLLICKKHIRTEKGVMEYKNSKLAKDYIKASIKAYEFMYRNYGDSIIYIHTPKLQSVFHFHKHYVPDRDFKISAVKRGLKMQLV